jgi:hypothetical protein
LYQRYIKNFYKSLTKTLAKGKMHKRLGKVLQKEKLNLQQKFEMAFT